MTQPRCRRIRLDVACAAAAALVVLRSPPVRAEDPGNAAAAQGLFDEARALMAAGQAAEACPKLEESQRLDPGSGTLMNLARCYEQTNRIATAWSTYLEAAGAARAARNDEREAGARERAAALGPRVSRLIIDVPAAVARLVVRRDGEPVGRPQWSAPVPVDAGEHVIDASAPGHLPWRSLAAVRGEGVTVRVVVPMLPVSPTSAPAQAHARRHGLGTQRILALVAGGVGLTGGVVASVFTAKALSDKQDAARACQGTSCSSMQAAASGNDAHAAGNITTVAVVVAAAGITAGLTLWFTAPAQASTAVTVGLGHVTLAGAF